MPWKVQRWILGKIKKKTDALSKGNWAFEVKLDLMYKLYFLFLRLKESPNFSFLTLNLNLYKDLCSLCRKGIVIIESQYSSQIKFPL